MARVLGFLLVGFTLLATGCGGGGGDAEADLPCDDVAFRGQDEELYVVQATISNVIGGGGDKATLQLDLRRGRAAIAGYLAAHPPCADDLKQIEERELDAVASLDAALLALDDGADPTASLEEALRLLESAQADLATAS